jgi:hypothetical protein
MAHLSITEGAPHWAHTSPTPNIKARQTQLSDGVVVLAMTDWAVTEEHGGAGLTIAGGIDLAFNSSNASIAVI